MRLGFLLLFLLVLAITRVQKILVVHDALFKISFMV